jgi:hypothetical protein
MMNTPDDKSCGVKSGHGMALNFSLESYGFGRAVGADEIRSADAEIDCDVRWAGAVGAARIQRKRVGPHDIIPAAGPVHMTAENELGRVNPEEEGEREFVVAVINSRCLLDRGPGSRRGAVHQCDAMRPAGLRLFYPADTLDHRWSERGDVTVGRKVGEIEVGQPVPEVPRKVFPFHVVIAARHEQPAARKSSDPVCDPRHLVNRGGGGEGVEVIAGDRDGIVIRRHLRNMTKGGFLKMNIAEMGQAHGRGGIGRASAAQTMLKGIWCSVTGSRSAKFVTARSTAR